ncbi:unnamed protein product [Rhizoctonia solani]|uniref:Nephrocystin 3-like N-terminal domain-containing protein n=1 Tax=Rhizoctonia solani TaxID=456999 RepID=A0A8H3ALM7_9AGAM|nr:unnamed protein product [Rhizoctonia solani]
MTPPPEHSTQTWTQIHRLLDLLDSAESSELGSIREVMGRLVSCIKVCEYVAKEQQEYYALKDEMEETFAKLHSHLSWDISLATTASCKCICRSITSTLEKIERCIELQALLEWQGVSKYYKEIQGHLQQLTLNTDRMIWRTDRPNNRFKIPQGPLVDRTQYDSSTRVLVSEYSLGSTQNFVLDRIHNWIQNPRKKGDTTYWLNGMAGTGKTVVAYWLCEQLKSSCVLAASFFCSRSFPECQDARSIIPSIISQLALFSYPYQCVLARILVEGLHAHSGPLEKQFDTLIAKPLYEIQETLVAPPVVVIDALDECENKEIVCELIQTLLAQPPTLPLMFVLSSRPELEIRDQFSDRGGWSDDGAWISLDDQPMSNIKQDVLKYLQVRLNPLGLPESQLESLAQRAGAWFTYAAALARYIDSGHCGKSRDWQLVPCYITTFSRCVGDGQLQNVSWSPVRASFQLSFLTTDLQ